MIRSESFLCTCRANCIDHQRALRPSGGTTQLPWRPAAGRDKSVHSFLGAGVAEESELRPRKPDQPVFQLCGEQRVNRPACNTGRAQSGVHLGVKASHFAHDPSPVLSAVPTLLTSLAICEVPHRRWNMVNALGKALFDDEVQDIASVWWARTPTMCFRPSRARFSKNQTHTGRDTV